MTVATNVAIYIHMTTNTGWRIEVRDDVDTEWYEFTDGRAEEYETEKAAKAAVREYKKLGMLGYYDAVRVAPVAS